MWTILEARKAVKGIDKLPKHVLAAYEFWKNIVETSGPEGLREFSGFKDHVLKGEWAGHRSSYLNSAYRVIYRVIRDKVEVYVLEVTNHDYRRR